MIIKMILAAGLAAESTVQPCDYAHKIYAAIASSATYASWASNGSTCTIAWTPNPLKPITFIDMKAKKEALNIEFKVIKKKLDLNTASTIEKNRAVSILFELQDL